MNRFARHEDGYVLVLLLLMLPVLALMALLVIDISRGNAAQSDLVAAADAFALTAAQELDGLPDAVTRAEAAMAALENPVDFMDSAPGAARQVLAGTVAAGVVATFLTAIPASDDLPIDADWIAVHATRDGVQARYVQVVVTPPAGFLPFFNLPVVGSGGPMALRATAVAGPVTTACGVTPIFICNPYESATETLESVYFAGALHGRLVRLKPLSGGAERPGNFGFMTIPAAPDLSNASRKALSDVIAGAATNSCVSSTSVTTLGDAVNIADGQDTIFDIYESRYRNTTALYPPAQNVRKGWIPNNRIKPDYCKMSPSDPALRYAWGFPADSAMLPLAGGAVGALMGQGGWNIATYWQVNFGGALSAATRAAISSFAIIGPDGMILPSRYNVYRHEIAQGLVGTFSQGGPGASGQNRESGLPLCAMGQGVMPTTARDKRVIFAVVIDCLAHPALVQPRPVRSFASLFMPTAMDAAPEKNSLLDVEIIDLTGRAAGVTRTARLVR